MLWQPTHLLRNRRPTQLVVQAKSKGSLTSAVPHQALKRRLGRQAIASSAKGSGSDKLPSAFQRAAKLLKQKKQFQKDLEALEAQAESLSPKERRQLDTLLSKVKQPPEARGQTSREKQTGSEAKDFDPKQYRHFPEKELPAGEERVELPKNLRKLLEDAQVLDAVPWDGQPASPTAGSFPEETKESQLRDFVMNAGRKTFEMAGKGSAAVWEGYGNDIPNGPENEDDEFIDGDNEDFVPGNGVQEIIDVLESGQPLPSDPEYEGLTVESSGDFIARIEKLKHAYEAQFLDRRDWKISPEDFSEIWNAKLETAFPPWDPPEILEVQPAPDWGPEVQRHYDRFQWILFLLRKAHLQLSPSAPAEALTAAGLAADDIIFEDPVMESVGPTAWQDYMKVKARLRVKECNLVAGLQHADGLLLQQRIVQAGGRLEIGNIWGEMGKQRPIPNWRVYVDTWLSVPYPDWYLTYLDIHSEEAGPPNLGGLVSKQDPPRDPFDPEPNEWAPPPLRHPKGASSAKKRRRRSSKAVPSAAKQGQRERLEDEEPASVDPMAPVVAFTMNHRIPPSCGGTLLPGEGLYCYLEDLRKCQAGGDTGGAISKPQADAELGSWVEAEFFHTSAPWRGFQYPSSSPSPWTGPRARRRRQRTFQHKVLSWDDSKDTDNRGALADWRPDFGDVVHKAEGSQAVTKTTESPSSERQASSNSCSTQRSTDGLPQQFQILTYSAQAQLDSKKRLGFPGGAGMPDWRESCDVGQAWRSGKWFSVAMTTCYSIDNDSQQVDKVQTAWGGLLGHALGTNQDLVDLFMRQMQLFEKHDPRCQRVKVFKLTEDRLQPVPRTVKKGSA